MKDHSACNWWKVLGGGLLWDFCQCGNADKLQATQDILVFSETMNKAGTNMTCAAILITCFALANSA